VADQPLDAYRHVQRLLDIYGCLTQALCPEDVFGALVPSDEDTLDGVFRQLARECHPDRFAADPNDRELAQETFKRLNELRERARAKIGRGSYGVRDAPSDPEPADGSMELQTVKHKYRLRLPAFVEGDLCLLYRGTCLDGDGPDARVVVKIAREVADNELVRNEASVLARLSAAPSRHRKHLPVLLDQLRAEDRRGVVLREVLALDLTTVRERLPNGVPAEHAVWILSRLLSVLGFAHSLGIVHGNVEPAHVLVSPPDHNVFLIDWSYAAVEPAKTGERFRTVNEVYSAPEVAERGEPTPAADLYSAGRTMVYLLGGNPVSGWLPDTVPARLTRLISFLTLPSVRGRAQDAWEMHRELEAARTDLFGPKQFREFRV
jgi:serine/threonine protein kinase